jgi:hypothetical protein
MNINSYQISKIIVLLYIILNNQVYLVYILTFKKQNKIFLTTNLNKNTK